MQLNHLSPFAESVAPQPLPALGNLKAPYPWFALRTRSNFEKLAHTALENKGLTAYLPTYKSRRRWSDRVVIADTPLFQGYVFCRFDPFNRLSVLTTTGVISVVGCGNVLMAIDEEEIEAIEAILRSGLAAEPCPFLREGQRVRVRRGSLAGLEGILTKKKSDFRLVISVSMLQRSIAVEIDREWIEAA